jgi:predicted dehydrogenase
VSLVGLGAMGQRHARVLRDLESRFEIVGVYDPRAEAPTPPGAPRLASEAEALGRAEVVLVATPIETHAAIVARGLAAGRHVFVEKPVCASAGEARTASAAARFGARLFVGHSERFNPVVRTLARLVRDETVLSIDLRRVGPSRPCVSGVLVNLGVHDFDLAAYLGGGELTLRGAVGLGGGFRAGAPTPTGEPDAAHVLFSTAGGATGHLYVDRAAPTRERAIELTTARWVYRGDLLAHRLVRTARSGAARADVPLPLEEPLAAQAAALADALDGGAAREIAVGDDGVRALDLAEGALLQCVAAALSENFAIDAGRC